MSKYILAFSKEDSINPPSTPPSLPDLVELGILPKQVSEYTNTDIGSIISIPYTDESGNISGPIIFEVVGVNHHKDINDESKPTITLMTKNIIRYAAFDAKEPDNTEDSDRANYGNNRWSQSNIRQWLNSNGAANSWFSKQHDFDAAPNTTNVSFPELGAYSDEPGFLAGFSANVLQHFTDITNTTALCNFDGGGYETTVDKVFLASYTEMGYGNNNGVAEGKHLAVRYPDYNSRVKQLDNLFNINYWMRSPIVDYSSDLWSIDPDRYQQRQLLSHIWYERYRPAYSS
jgi:hypothetical protein